MTMSRECWLLHLLLVWCSLERTCLLTCVNAQNVTILQVTPAEGDPVEGNEVRLLCQAINVTMSGYIIEWTRIVDAQQEVSLARNGKSEDPRYTLFEQESSWAQNKMEILSFNATKEDTVVSYGCRVRDSVELNSTILEDAQTISFTVLYFPSAMYPICIPAGPITVQEGTTVNMSCTTEIGNPAVQIQILKNSTIYEWTYRGDSKEKMRSLQLMVTAADDEGSYECKINPGTNSTPFTGMERSCTMGPITVGPMTSTSPDTSNIHSTTPDTEESTAWPDDMTTIVSPTTTSFPLAIIAGAAGGGGFVIVLIIILLILYICKCGCFKKDKQDPSLLQTNLPLTESNDNHKPPWEKQSGFINQDVEEMREKNPFPGFIQIPQTEDALETKEMETPAGEDVMYDQPWKKSTFKEQNKDGDNYHPQGIDASCVDAEDAGVESDETVDMSSPVYGKVQKIKNKPQVNKEAKMSDADNAELWLSTDPSAYDLVLNEDKYTEIPNMADIDPGLKPTAIVKPIVYQTVSNPEDDLQSSPHSNDGASPSVGNKPNIKKFKPKDRSESQPPRGDSNPARSPSQPIASTPPSSTEPPQSPDDRSPPIEQHGNTPQDDHNEEARYAEVSHNHAKPHEAVTSDDHHDITYAELDLNPPTSDALPQPQEDQTLYASITIME